MHEGEKKMSKKRHCLWAALLAVILMCSPGCSKKDTGIDQGEANIPTQAPLAETVTAAPTFSLAISLKLSIFLSSKTTWTPLKQLPSFSSIKPKALESRMVRTQPQTVTFFPLKEAGL